MIEISQYLDDSVQRHSFVQTYFSKLPDKGESIIFPHRITHEANGKNNFVFGGISAVEGWILQMQDGFCIYLAVKDQAELKNKISAVWGKADTEASLDFSINGQDAESSFISWSNKKYKIYLTGFRAFQQVEKYRGCKLLIIGNIDYGNTFFLMLETK